MNVKERGKSFLEHYGVKGMRWGVRRTDAQLGKKGKSEDDGDHKNKKVVGKTNTKAGPASQLSDARLKKINNRLQMEQQYNRMVAENPSVMARGRKFFTDIAVSVAKTQITRLANDAVSMKIDEVMKARGAAKIPKLPANLRRTLPAPTGPRLG